MTEVRSYIYFSNHLALGLITHEEYLKHYSFAYIFFSLTTQKTINLNDIFLY